MKDLFSPANIITVTGGVLTVVGAIAYGTGAANLSVPTLFYGFPIFLGGLALKTSELPPTKRISAVDTFKAEREKAPEELSKLLGDVTRWRYGQKVHLDSSLQVLKLWDDDNPPQLLEIEELVKNGSYGLRLRFHLAGVSLERWENCKDRLGRFFAAGLTADLITTSSGNLDLILLQKQKEVPSVTTNKDELI